MTTPLGFIDGERDDWFRVRPRRGGAGGRAPIGLEAVYGRLERADFARQLTDCSLEEFEAFAQRSVGIEG